MAGDELRWLGHAELFDFPDVHEPDDVNSAVGDGGHGRLAAASAADAGVASFRFSRPILSEHPTGTNDVLLIQSAFNAVSNLPTPTEIRFNAGATSTLSPTTR